jgi:hypothetical protein
MYNHKNLRCRLNDGRMEPGSSKQVLVWVIRALNAVFWRNMRGLRATLVSLHAYMNTGILENEQ